MRTAAAIAAFCLLLPGCHYLRPLKGGLATAGMGMGTGGKMGGSGQSHTPAAASGIPTATLTPPENPNTPSGQESRYVQERETVLPAESVVKTETAKPDGGTITVTETFPAGTIRREKVSQGVKQTIGAAQKDMGRELAAKLKAYSKLQFIGVGLMVFSLAGLFWAPLRVALGGGKQFPIGVGVLGLGLTVAPMLIAGNEGVILLGAAVVACGYWLVIRLTRKEAEADLTKNGP